MKLYALAVAMMLQQAILPRPEPPPICTKDCITIGTTAVVKNLRIQEADYSLLTIRAYDYTVALGMNTPSIGTNHKVYSIVAQPDWTCAPTTGTSTAVTIVCVKSDAKAKP